MTADIAEPSRSQLGRVARGGALNLVGAGVSAAGSFLVVVVVANELTEEAAGQLFTGVSVFLIGVAICTLGTDTGLARFLLAREAHGEHAELHATTRIAFWPVASTTLVVAAAILALADPFAELIGLPPPDGPAMLRVFAVAMPFAVITDFWLACTRALGTMRPTVAIESIPLSALQVVLVVLAGAMLSDPLGVSAAWVAPYLATAALAAVLAGRMLRERARLHPPLGELDRSAVRRDFWSYTWPRGVARIGQVALARLDIVLVAALTGAADAAVYTAATRFVVLGQLAAQAIQRVLQPRFAHLIAKGELDIVRDVFKVSTAWSMALSWPVYLLAACAAPLYLQLFGPGYSDSGVPVVIAMALAMMLAVAAGPLDTLLLMAGRSGTSLMITLSALAIDVVLCLLLIPRIGILGAALAWAVSILVRNALTLWQVHHLLGITPMSRAAGLVAAISVTCLALPLVVVDALGRLDLVTVVVVAAAGGVLFCLAMWRFREPLALDALAALRPGAGTDVSAAAARRARSGSGDTGEVEGGME